MKRLFFQITAIKLAAFTVVFLLFYACQERPYAGARNEALFQMMEQQQIDTALFPNWRQADSLYGADSRYTDSWCEWAIGIHDTSECWYPEAMQ